MTGVLLAAAVDRREAANMPGSRCIAGAMSEAAYTYWAKKFAWRACMMRVDFTCEPPEE